MAEPAFTENDTRDGDEREVSEVTRPDELETERVKLVSGVVEAPVTRIAPRDGTIKGEPVYSDLHCPLLVDDVDVVKTAVVETHVGADGLPAGRTVHRVPEQLVVDPIACPDCGKMVERHMLVVNNATGTRDCPIAINFRARGKTAELASLAPGARVAAVDEASPEPLLETAPDGAIDRGSGLAFDPATGAKGAPERPAANPFAGKKDAR